MGMKCWVAAVLAVALTGCAENGAGGSRDGLAGQLRPDCYTVDLFRDVPIQAPGPNVPDDVKAFLGVWAQGAWAGVWCHDLHVVSASADGSVEILSLHGPYYEIGQEPTIFRRRGQVRDGVLTVPSFRSAVHRYRLDGRYLLAERSSGSGTLRAVLIRDADLVAGQTPPPRPAT